MSEDLIVRTAANPFGDAPVTSRPAGGALAQTDQQRAIAEVQAAMVIARANPRDQLVAMDRILNACMRPTLADAAVYEYSRGGTAITGPSIRLAEAMAQAWGNVSFGIRELEQRAGESTVQAFCWDVETNTRREVTFQVPHVRHTKSGAYPLKDPRDVYEMVANQGARRLRACILAVIPGDVTEAALAQCNDTLTATADVTPEGRQKLVDAFDAFGVTVAQIEKRIQRRIDTITPAQVVGLKRVYASLRDGMSDVSTWFDPVETQGGAAPATGEPTSASERVKDRLRKKKDEAAPAAQEKTSQAEPEKADAPAAKAQPTKTKSYAEFVDDLKAAANDPKRVADVLAAAKAILPAEFFDELESLSKGGLI